MIAAVTAGWRMTNASASWISVMPGLVGELRERVGGVELALVRRDREVVALREHRARAATSRSSAPLRHLPDSQPPASGLHGITPMPWRRQVGSTSASIPRTRIEYGGCSQTKRSRPRRSATHCASTIGSRRERRGADVADLARRDEVGQRAERLVDVGVGLGAVDLVEVDPVGAEPAQAVLDLAHDPAARVAELVRVVAHRAVDLRGEHDVVAPAAGQRLADDLLGLAARVDVGGVDEVDAGVERAVDDADRLVVVGVAPGAEHHRAEAERADLHAGAAERAVLHARRRYRSGATGPERVTIAVRAGGLQCGPLDCFQFS